MMVARRSIVWGTAAAALLAAAGCGGSGSSSETANVKAGDMPPGGDWTGVWYSPLYGYLHLVHEGTTVSGKWMRPAKDKWGELHGKATGDVVRFSWTEYTIGLVGPNSKRTGKGYFKYKSRGDDLDDMIEGEIGRDESEVGNPWDGIKQRNQLPDLDSIGGSGATDIGAGDWDGGNQESGDVEAPEPPPDE